jgi:hypothetical protein
VREIVLGCSTWATRDARRWLTEHIDNLLTEQGILQPMEQGLLVTLKVQPQAAVFSYRIVRQDAPAISFVRL